MTRRAPLLLCLVLLACGGAAPRADAPVSATATRRSVTGAPGHVEIPAGYAAAGPMTWTRKTAQGPVILHVAVQSEPAEGADAELDRRLRALEREGEAGVERDERITLGDLDARLVHTVTLRAAPPLGLWLVVTAAEHGMYVVSAAGPRAALRAHQPEIEGFLRSLRVPPPAPPRPEPSKSQALDPEVLAPDDGAPPQR